MGESYLIVGPTLFLVRALCGASSGGGRPGSGVDLAGLEVLEVAELLLLHSLETRIG